MTFNTDPSNTGAETMNWLKKLPGFERSAPGLERALWKRLPLLLGWGTAAPMIVALIAWWVAPDQPSAAGGLDLRLVTYQLIGLVVLHWTLILTVAIGCVIVMVMKGPAYVADAYPLPDWDDSTVDVRRGRP